MAFSQFELLQLCLYYWCIVLIVWYIFAQDSPDTARAMLSAQAKRWLIAAGAQLVTADGAPYVSGGDSVSTVAETAADADADEALCEVSSLVSYAGEGLEQYAGKQLTIPFYLN